MAQRLAVAAMDGRRAGHALVGQMVQQAKEEWQIVRINPFFVDRQDVAAPVRLQQIIGVLNPLGNALQARGRADVVLGDEARQVFVINFRINRHDMPP